MIYLRDILALAGFIALTLGLAAYSVRLAAIVGGALLIGIGLSSALMARGLRNDTRTVIRKPTERS